MSLLRSVVVGDETVLLVEVTPLSVVGALSRGDVPSLDAEDADTSDDEIMKAFAEIDRVEDISFDAFITSVDDTMSLITVELVDEDSESVSAVESSMKENELSLGEVVSSDVLITLDDRTILNVVDIVEEMDVLSVDMYESTDEVVSAVVLSSVVESISTENDEV